MFFILNINESDIMSISLDLYHIFYIVAKEGSISAAANILFISQPAITFQIKKLEEQLGVVLFTRTKHGMILTDEGKVLLDYVKNGIENIRNGENALSNLKNLDSGTIRIGVSTTICRYILIPYLENFHAKYPNINIQINNNISNNLIKELRNGNLDILMLFSPSTENKDLKIIPVIDVQDIFVGNKKYYDLTKGKTNLHSLKSFPLIFPNSSSNSRTYLNKYLKDNNVDLKPKLEVLSYNLIVDLIKAGFGIGYVTKEFIRDELKNNSLYEIKVTPGIKKRTIVIATMNKKEPNYSVKKLMEIIGHKED